MAKKIKRYRIQNYTEALGWRYVPCIETSSLLWCHGYVTAVESLYPSMPHRIVEVLGKNFVQVIRETKGRGKVHVN